MKKVLLTAFIATAVSFAACNNANDKPTATQDGTANDDETVKAFIKKEDANFEEEVKRGDTAAMASHYASDAMVMPANSEPIKAKDILSFWGGALRMGVKEVKLDVTDITGSGDIYAETGNVELFAADHQSIEKGKYVVVWKKENGSWKMYRDIWNSNLPAPAAK